MNLPQVLEALRTDPETAGGIVHWETISPRPAKTRPFPEFIDRRLIDALKQRGIDSLYSHQAEAIEKIQAGKNVVVVTPTASGKTLCYNLPVLNNILKDPEARALYLFPTKALSADQVDELHGVVTDIGADIKTYTFDGDTPQDARRAIRSAGHVVVTNPDMLHAGILPHHTKWIKLFENLKYIVIDEVHQYRGIFGSHLANLIRRLRRICHFYESDPQFICCSATIANPAELASKLIEAPVEKIDDNGAPAGEKHFILYNPPVINPELGLRRSAVNEAVRLASHFIKQNIQTIVFGRYRVQVEIILTYLRERFKKEFDRGIEIAGYRGGYLPNERRAIEEGVRNGKITGVVSTNALELGIDIGSLDVSIMCGYPGSISSVWQQAGRAGRKAGVSAAIMVATSSPLPQFLMSHPDYFFHRSPEEGIIDPDNLIIRSSHIKCAAFELPVWMGEKIGPEPADEILDYFEEKRIVRRSGDKYYWSSDIYPANEVSLRSASPENFVILNISDKDRVIGEVDYFATPELLHPEAIYIHGAQTFQVMKLDWEGRRAHVQEVKVDYYTDAESKTDLKMLEADEEKELTPLCDSPDEAVEVDAYPVIGHGDIALTRVVVLFKKVKFHTHENVGSGPVALPEQEMHTTAFWYRFPQDFAVTGNLTEKNIGGGLRGVANVLQKIAPLWLMCDPRDIRAISRVRDPFTGAPTLYIYDNVPGGVGFAEKLYGMAPGIFEACRDHLTGCVCTTGCPSCSGPPLELGDHGKSATLKILKLILEDFAVQA
ncbi:MAG: DEAD/DEAH box helicase [FCB group bacterium]|nr:DEAD/DEAH box helicase [FCB group bacterium]